MIINLRRARKAKVRAAALVEAEAQRALHGRTMAEVLQDRQAAVRLDRALDGARLTED